MTGKFGKSFKIVSMLLVAAAMLCTFSLAGSNETVFWAMLGTVSAVSLAYLLIFLGVERELDETRKNGDSKIQSTERCALGKFPAPVCIVNSKGVIQWCNDEFTERVYADDIDGKLISDIADIDCAAVFSQTGRTVDFNSAGWHIRAVADGRHSDENDPESQLCIVYFEDIKENLALKEEKERLVRPKISLEGEGFLENFPSPAAAVDRDNIVKWANSAFTRLIDENPCTKNLNDILQVDMEAAAADKGAECSSEGGGLWRVTCTDASGIDADGTRTDLTMLYFEDKSGEAALRQMKNDNRSCAVMILIDSFDEVFSGVKESDKAHITIKIDELCEKHFSDESGGILKKLSEDRYFAVISEKSLSEMIEDRFEKFGRKIQKIQQIRALKGYHITLSLGIGRGGTLKECQRCAEDALKEAQSFGGDRVYVMNTSGEKTPYLFNSLTGGEDSSRKSRVKVREFARELKDLIRMSDRVIIMGHTSSDFDSVGSAAGLCGAIRCMGHEAYVYVNMKNTVSQAVIDRLMENPGAANIFLPESELFTTVTDSDGNEQRVISDRLFTENTLLIVVDTHILYLLDSKPLYDKAISFERPRVVYIDHHIKEDKPSIDREILRLHDQYASSACEMVTEVINCFELKKELHSYYADAMLAGIIQDTKNFVLKTEAATFAAAVSLKEMGADTVKVKTLAAIPDDTSIKRSMIIQQHQVYRRCAVSFTGEMSAMDEIAAVQAADEMLNIEGVDASFVMYPVPCRIIVKNDTDGTETESKGKKIKISARSFQITKMNVQLVMSSLGGGGHKEQAAAVIDTEDFDEAKSRLFAAIDDYLKKIN